MNKATELIDAYLAKWGLRGAYGPAHIVVDDDNLDDHSLDFCLDVCDHPEKQAQRFPADLVADTKTLLLALKQIPERERDYQDEP